MMYTDKDIRCFVMSCDRPELLSQTLKTLIWQQGGPWDIWVLDNSSNNETEKLISEKYPNIHYVSTRENQNRRANLHKLQELAQTAYTLTLHDDDLLAPNYLQNVLKTINYYPNISGIFSKYTTFTGSEFPNIIAPINTRHWLFNKQADFALSFWHKPQPSWTGSVLKSAIYRKIDFEKNHQMFGKISDWPLLIKVIKGGNTVIFTDNYIYYRIHNGQDTHDDNTGITLKQLANYIKFFKDFAITKKELKDIYIVRAYERALSNYNFFLQKNEQKNCKDLFAWFEKENLNIPPMSLYHKILKNKALTPIKHLFKRFYKRDYFKQFITDFK